MSGYDLKNRSTVTGLTLVDVVPVHMLKRSVRFLARHRVLLLHVRRDIQLFGHPQRLVNIYVNKCMRRVVLRRVILTRRFFRPSADTYGGYVGLAITQTVGLVGLVQWEIRQLASLENQMTSVERVLDYANCPQEADFKSPRGNHKNASFLSSGVVIILFQGERGLKILSILDGIVHLLKKHIVLKKNFWREFIPVSLSSITTPLFSSTD